VCTCFVEKRLFDSLSPVQKKKTHFFSAGDRVSQDRELASIGESGLRFAAENEASTRKNRKLVDGTPTQCHQCNVQEKLEIQKVGKLSLGKG